MDESDVMCPVRVWAVPKLLLVQACCLCDNWCHVGCSYQTHFGRVCPCNIRILGPKRKIMVLSHPCMEDYVVLPARSTVRIANRQNTQEIKRQKQCMRTFEIFFVQVVRSSMD